MAGEYLKTITVLTEGQIVPVEELYLNPLGENLLSRIKVKNGVEFFIQLPENHQTEGLSGGILEGDKIKVSKAGTLGFFFKYNGKKVYVLGDVNYFGVLQFNGSDALDEIEVTQGNEGQTLGVPKGAFPSIGWLASPLGESNFQLLHTNFTQNSMRLSEILQKAKEKFPNIKEFLLKGDFYDGTSNGQAYSESEHIVQIKDKRIPVTQYSVTLSAQPSQGGQVSGAGNYEENSSVTVSASPKEGWKFVRWTENGAQVSTSASFTFQITKNRNLIAHFEQIPVTQYSVNLSAQPSEGGQVTGAGNYDENSQVTVSATANSGWKFVKWTEGGSVVSTSNSYQFTITKNRNLVAHFEQIPVTQYSVSLSAQPAEGGTVSGAGTYDENSSVTVSATANSGWKFVKWTEGGSVVSTSDSYQFTITKNRNLVAVFEQKDIAPTITTASLPEGKEGENYSFQLSAEGTAPITWSIVSGNLPAGISLSNEGLLSGTPNQNGTFTFTVKASNEAGNSQKQFSLVVKKKALAPTITTASLPEGKEGENYSFQLSAEGTAPITWAIVSGNLPAGLSLSNEGHLSGTPNQNGTFTFMVKASNQAGEDQKQLALVVKKDVSTTSVEAPSLTITPEEIILEGETLFLYSVRGTLLRSGETHINRSGLSGVFLLTTKKRTMKIVL
ncbi:putative Ig domain-containing protein [Porphyromonas gulae]|uniref:InlB B-repeat-containing protein n=1 Tax=Porphyromonas gulae TaxID=111105 RepID=UPI0026EA8A45|nr:putative Ig domain-containing protein [Porphyromonas gulae]